MTLENALKRTVDSYQEFLASLEATDESSIRVAQDRIRKIHEQMKPLPDTLTFADDPVLVHTFKIPFPNGRALRYQLFNSDAHREEEYTGENSDADIEIQYRFDGHALERIGMYTHHKFFPRKQENEYLWTPVRPDMTLSRNNDSEFGKMHHNVEGKGRFSSSRILQFLRKPLPKGTDPRSMEPIKIKTWQAGEIDEGIKHISFTPQTLGTGE
jgi:hypothetical protein